MNAPTKVGLFTLAALAAGALMVLRVEDIRLGEERRADYQATFPTAQGLEEKADVRLNGVRVGVVKKLELLPDGVRVIAQIARDVELREGAVASVGTLGLLGEKHLEIRQGPVGAQRLPEGTSLPSERAASFEDAVELATQLGGDLSSVSKNLRSSLGGETGHERLEAMVKDVLETTARLAKLVAANERNVDRTVENFRAFSASMRDFGDRVQQLAQSREGQVGQSVDNVAELTQKLNAAAAHLEEISARVQRGEGPLGALVGDEQTAAQLRTTVANLQEGVANVRQVIDRIVDTQIQMGLRTEYLTQRAALKGYFHFDVVPPKSPRFYRLEVVGQPFGLRTVTTTTTTLTPSDGSAPSTVEVRQEERTDAFAFSLLVGWRLKALVLRGGVFESTGGAGADVLLFGDRLRLSGDAWDFSRDGLSPHLKIHGAYYPFKNVWVMAGWDDFLNVEHELSSIFVGAGLYWDAEDVKYIIPWVSLP